MFLLFFCFVVTCVASIFKDSVLCAHTCFVFSGDIKGHPVGVAVALGSTFSLFSGCRTACPWTDAVWKSGRTYNTDLLRSLGSCRWLGGSMTDVFRNRSWVGSSCRNRRWLGGSMTDFFCNRSRMGSSCRDCRWLGGSMTDFFRKWSWEGSNHWAGTFLNTKKKGKRQTLDELLHSFSSDTSRYHTIRYSTSQAIEMNKPGPADFRI